MKITILSYFGWGGGLNSRAVCVLQYKHPQKYEGYDYVKKPLFDFGFYKS